MLAGADKAAPSLGDLKILHIAHDEPTRRLLLITPHTVWVYSGLTRRWASGEVPGRAQLGRITRLVIHKHVAAWVADGRLYACELPSLDSDDAAVEVVELALPPGAVVEDVQFDPSAPGVVFLALLKDDNSARSLVEAEWRSGRLAFLDRHFAPPEPWLIEALGGAGSWQLRDAVALPARSPGYWLLVFRSAETNLVKVACYETATRSWSAEQLPPFVQASLHASGDAVFLLGATSSDPVRRDRPQRPRADRRNGEAGACGCPRRRHLHHGIGAGIAPRSHLRAPATAGRGLHRHGKREDGRGN